MGTRIRGLETTGVEAFTSLDGQGKPSYGASVDVEARVVRVDEVIVGPDGTNIRTTLRLYVPGTETYSPKRLDRITVGDETFIVEERRENHGLRADSGTLDHARLRCRDE